jgi:hypothetical protein
MGKMEDAILGRDHNPRVEEQNQMVEGKIKRITAQGIYFTLKDWDNGKHEFGPAPYTWPALTVTSNTNALSDNGTLVIGGTPEPHTHTSPHTHQVPIPVNQPVGGDRCLVVFVGGGVEDPWVIGWWPAA